MERVSNTIHEAYINALVDVWYHPQFNCAPRNLPIREIMNYTFVVNDPVSEPIKTKDLERNKVIEVYTAKEVELYNSCTKDVKDFAEASKFWNQLANPDGTVNSAYGYLIWKNKSHGNPKFEFGETAPSAEYLYRTPWEWCVESLKDDKDSRQAILRFSLPEHQWKGNKDQTCTMHGIFLIRDDKLHFSVEMRSNDLMKGLVYDLPWFVNLMDLMIEELKPHYPLLTKGSYMHRATSMHIYERDAETIKRMIGI